MNSNPPKNELGILILAAGSSTRMGQPKQLLPWKNTTLLGNTIETAKALTKNILVVLGAHAELIEEKIPKDVNRIINIGWNSGMGTSIALGVQQLERALHPERILILLVDQPLIDSDYLKEMISRAEAPIVATAYGKKIGVPVIFEKSYFEALKDLGADYGARYLLKKYRDSILVLNAAGKEVDLDTPENYDQYYKSYGK